MTRRCFLTIEGLSGSGKTTVATAVAAALKGRYYKTPPDLLAPIRAQIDGRTTSLVRHLYYCAGIAQASEEIGRQLDRSAVVCDKYLATVLAYSRAAGTPIEVPLHDLVVPPTFSFFIDTPDQIRWSRIRLRGIVSDDHERFLRMEVVQEVRQRFLALGLLNVDNSGASVQSAVEQICRHVQEAQSAT